jgi:hypothetical protein
MKKIIIVLGILFVLATLIVNVINAERFNKLELDGGENEVYLNESLGYVSDLVRLYPEIETISYIEGNETIGYVNVFGGIGTNFFIEANKSYEIVLSKEVIIYSK